MISAVWRIKSNDFEAKKFIQKYNLDPDTIFEDGFNLCIIETKTKNEVIQNTLSFIENHQITFKELAAQNIKSQIDIGVTVGTRDQD